MSSAIKTKEVREFGDFQTPKEIARKACQILAKLGLQPKTIVEPTCGLGNFLLAALEQFPSFSKAIGVDVSPAYVKDVKSKVESRKDKKHIEIIEGDFFRTGWSAILSGLPDPMLVIGNPPWVTNANLSVLNSSNVPEKSNFQKHSGFDAMTGKSNFDISEWMLIRVLHWLNNRDAVMGMLCKTTVARKLLKYAWKNDISLSDSSIYRLNASSHFGASVDACFFVCRFSPSAHNPNCRVYDNLDSELFQTIGSRDNELVASLELFERWKHLRGRNDKWRSGIKHDCSRVMELTKEGDKYRNGFGETVELETDFIYPMFKSSDIANNSPTIPKRWMLVTQKSVGDETSVIENKAPKTWEYLQKYAHLLDKRGSSIYKNRPRFSIFGIGDYSFSSWKVAISGFYKKLCFKTVGEHNDKPIVLDDTSYFIPCKTEEEAEHITKLLNLDIAKEFFEAHIFWDCKRPITIDILRRLDLERLKHEY